ncbi:unnamed protein product [Rhizoctonia solani]|uniref:Uncharacterized protein n=1 Tax=Rhizoctonia solani TaxID=456999 RepID=A0A8H3DV70_9AGAM|nr:unnamed protein product [Rhizoctonia solani]
MSPHIYSFPLSGIRVAKNAIVGFEKGMSYQTQDDVLSILLLALCWSKKHSPFDNPRSWYNEVESKLLALGCHDSTFEWGVIKVHSDTTLGRAVIEDLDDDSGSAIEKAMAAVGTSKNKQALGILSSSAASRNKTAFATLDLHAFFGNIAEPNDNVLESRLKTGDELQCGRIQVNLTHSVARKRRGFVRENLGRSYEDHVKTVDDEFPKSKL